MVKMSINCRMRVSTCILSDMSVLLTPEAQQVRVAPYLSQMFISQTEVGIGEAQMVEHLLKQGLFGRGNAGSASVHHHTTS